MQKSDNRWFFCKIAHIRLPFHHKRQPLIKEKVNETKQTKKRANDRGVTGSY